MFKVSNRGCNKVNCGKAKTTSLHTRGKHVLGAAECVGKHDIRHDRMINTYRIISNGTYGTNQLVEDSVFVQSSYIIDR